MDQKRQSEILNELFKKFNLVYDADNKKDSDVFISRNFKIITRAGIQKIQAKMNIEANYDVVFVNDTSIIMKGTFSYNENGTVISTQTFGEASVNKKEFHKTRKEIHHPDGKRVIEEDIVEVQVLKGNVFGDPPYIAAMAEKRALSRGVLQLAGLYKLGVFGEDEADDFKNEIKKQINNG